ncbi:MAG: hypothetical protein L3J71_07850 [Victivallaceae bacterium]|nr:hypothetical protein [Victivallaceae bacterium]
MSKIKNFTVYHVARNILDMIGLAGIVYMLLFPRQSGEPKTSEKRLTWLLWNEPSRRWDSF